MAKKGREARIMRTITKIRGEKMSLALQKRALARPNDASALDEDAPKKSSWRRRKDRAKVRAEARGDADAPHGYHGGARVLLIGDGNMTFALALTTLFGGDGSGVVATTDVARRDAGRALAGHEDVCEAIEACGGAVVHEITCDDLGDDGVRAALRARVGGKAFDRVVFNFPDAGCGRVGALSVKAQRTLLASFLTNAQGLIGMNGEIRVTLRADAPWSTWNVEGLAMKAGLAFKASVEFDADEFPGYEYCHTPGEDEREEEITPRTEDIEGECVTYVFVRKA
jgi:25S rRNA (uracil2634-N3)-methyltransferase